MLNDIGLCYADLKKHKKALSCFEQIQKSLHWNSKGRKFQAIVLQNIGAMYTYVEKYEQSVDYNKQASEIYG